MKHIFIYIPIVVHVLFSACTAEQDLLSEREDHSQGTPLSIYTSLRSDDDKDYEAFTEGSQIRVYYDYQNLPKVPWWRQGVYTFPSNGDKNTPWEYDKEADDKSIFIEDIKSTNLNGRYYFTATSYPEPIAEGASCYHVKSDQTTDGYASSDFLVARAVYKNKLNFTDPAKGLTLHFRHVLSRLVVKINIPKGKPEDGYFGNYDKLKITPVIQQKQVNYEVTYDNKKGDREILETTLLKNDTPVEINMYPESETPEKIKITIGTEPNVEAACYTYSSILPIQPILQGQELLKIKIDDKLYTYTPPEANTIELKQEMITIVNLTLLSGPGNKQLKLNKVEQVPWKYDEANVGDLFPVKE